MKNNNREKSLLKNTIIISIGTVCTKLITFLLLPLYTGLLNTSEYGIVDLLNTLVFLLIPIITFQVEQAVFRELLETRGNVNDSKIIISSSLCSVAVQCVIFAGMYYIVSFFIYNEYKIYLLLNIIVNIFSSLLLQISRGLGKTKEYSIGSFINALVTIVFNVLFLVVLKLKVTGMLLGTFIGHIICIVYLFNRLNISDYLSYKYFDYKIVKKLWKYSLPLIPNAISWWIFTSSDRVIVSTLLGLSANGILSVATKFSSIVITIYNIFDRSWIESISLHIDDNDITEYFNKMFNIITNIFISFTMLFISFMPVIYPLLINKEYIDGYNLVPILLIGSLFTVCQGLLAVVYAAKKNTKSIAKTSIVAAILNIIIHFALINTIGLYAAVVSTLISYFVIFIYRFIDIRKKYFKVSYDIKRIITSILVLSIVIFLYYINTTLTNSISVIISTIFVIVLNYQLLKTVIGLIKNKFLRREKNEK